MSSAKDADSESRVDSFLRGGLLYNLLFKGGLAHPGMPGVRTRSMGLICLTYIPLVILAATQGVALNQTLKVPFLFDISELVRFIFVGPLLIAAEAIIEPWLIQVVSHTRSRLVPADRLPEFEATLCRTRRWRDSPIPEIALLIVAFVGPSLDTHLIPQLEIGTWHLLPSESTPSNAALYYAYFAKPLVRFLWLRWLWHYLLWSAFLIRLSSMPLKVIATHPDREGGLAFITVGHSRLSLLAFGFGLQASSILATQILLEGKSLFSFKYEIIGILSIMLGIFLTPLLAFTGKLLEAKRKGLFDYGALADEYTEAFHTKWISGERGNEVLLGTGDIQSLADLGNSYEVVREMKSCLIGKNIITIIAVSTLLPFAPLILTVYPFDELLRNLLKAVM